MFLNVHKGMADVKADFMSVGDDVGDDHRYYLDITDGDSTIHFGGLSRGDMATIIDRLESCYKALTGDEQAAKDQSDDRRTSDRDPPTTGVTSPGGYDRPGLSEQSPEFPHGNQDRGCQHVLPGQPACGPCWVRAGVADQDAKNMEYDRRIKAGELR